MNQLPPALIDPLSRYLDEEEDEAALRRAGAWLQTNAVDIATLFDWLHAYTADKLRKSRAEVVLRSALKLPLVPGPVCRPTPS